MSRGRAVPGRGAAESAPTRGCPRLSLLDVFPFIFILRSWKVFFFDCLGNCAQLPTFCSPPLSFECWSVRERRQGTPRLLRNPEAPRRRSDMGSACLAQPAQVLPMIPGCSENQVQLFLTSAPPGSSVTASTSWVERAPAFGTEG